MRILVACACYPTPQHPKFLGGAETFSVQLCEALAARGNAVCVVRSGPVWDAWVGETVNGVEVITLPTRNLYYPWQERSTNPYVRAAWHLLEDHPLPSFGFDRILREFMPDVLHTNSLYGLTTAIWSKAKAHSVAVVHTLHDYYLTCARGTRFNNGVRCQSSCASCSCLTVGRRRATEFVDTVVSVSERALAIHRECGLFGNGVNQAIIRNPPPRARGDEVPVQADGNKVTFGFIGRPSVEKGMFDLLSAFRKLPKELGRLLVAGHTDADTRERILDCIGDADCELLGFITPDAFFRRIDAMVIPSIWEDPCPMVIGESFAHARPVIGARRGGIPELIGDLSGWLYEPETGELEALLLAIASEKAVIAAKSQHLLSEPNLRNFDDLVTEYVSVYKKTITTHQGFGERSA